jgi:UDP-N-acetylmuramoyl-tripeptide--D-alanyl-D-alanine ligase
MTLAEAAAVLAGKTSGAPARFDGVSTDSRSLKPNELFVALRGERFDGHDFLAAAAQRGAAGAMVDRRCAGPFPLPVVIVDDTRRALGALARAWRRRFSPALVAVTGSNGKTTVKEMLAAILRAHAGEPAVLATSGNLNNDIGVPLTVLRLRGEHRWCALELGMNHRGEIAYLAGIAAPTVALVNNAQREHLEFMNSVEEVAAENGSVYEALAADGIAVVNADDAHAAYFKQRADPHRVLDFGLAGAAVTGRYELKHLSSEIRIRTPQGETGATLAIPGLHNVRNALAAAACALAAGVPAASIGPGLSAFRPYAGSKGRAAGRSSTIPTTPIRTRCARRSTCWPRAPARRHSCSATWGKSGRRARNSTAKSAITRAPKASIASSRWARRRRMRSPLSVRGRAISTRSTTSSTRWRRRPCSSRARAS